MPDLLILPCGELQPRELFAELVTPLPQHLLYLALEGIEIGQAARRVLRSDVEALQRCQTRGILGIRDHLIAKRCLELAAYLLDSVAQPQRSATACLLQAL